MKIYIYSLSDPNTNEIRYIGKTGNIKNRYNSHLSASRHLKTHLGSWIKSLLAKNILPIINIIEECTLDNWEKREIYHISQYTNLVNHSKGGNEPLIIKSNIKGYVKSGNKYKVSCSFNNTVYYLGTFNTIIEAKQVYNHFQENPLYYINSIKPKHNRNGVNMYKDNILIKSFKSIADCARYINTEGTYISNCCKGKCKQHKGYSFEYKKV